MLHVSMRSMRTGLIGTKLDWLEWSLGGSLQILCFSCGSKIIKLKKKITCYHNNIAVVWR